MYVSRKYFVFTAILSCLFSASIHASQWTSFTNVNTVRAFAYDQSSSEILLASWGGVLSFQPDREEISIRGRVEGFSSVDFTGVVIDQAGRLFLSTADRGMDIQFSGGTIRNAPSWSQNRST